MSDSFVPLLWIFPVLVLVTVFVLIVAGIAQAKRPEILLQEWTARHGLHILSWEQRLFFTGPFFWAWGRKGSTVYRVLFQDVEGTRAHAFVRCTPQFWGYPADPVEIRWEE